MADLFVALGYGHPRLNIHMSGREIDLRTEHRLEPRLAVAECKATTSPVGGDDINKFVGALDAEGRGAVKVIGYFISLGGFRETAIEQERQGRRTKIITLNGTQVVQELINGRILIAREVALELAGRTAIAPPDLRVDPTPELLAHERGWIWCVFYTQGKLRTHFVLIHSDGTPLARMIAEEVIAADRACKGTLHTLQCFNPHPINGTTSNPVIEHALDAYFRYIAAECGYIQLDGLPADTDVGSLRLRLENLFVPLYLNVKVEADTQSTHQRQVLGKALAKNSRIAILSPPGGGKSTLIKRLATAYADPSRQGESGDQLPDRPWLPLFIRCRELRDLARGSFSELLDAIANREPVRQYAEVFRAYIDRCLLEGRVLLLVDGLDEISDPGDRAAFVSTLRSALQAYSSVPLVVTSRESGFRHVAAHLATTCVTATISPFDADDIRRLSVAWHKEVLGDTEKVRADAVELATTIAGNDRIQRLAINPLLLTTLLLVRRWVGSLPTRRAVLYGKAVEVLLMTWNTEGHEPIPEEEALPQLCYVASDMMLNGVQKISRPKLASLLRDSRDALPMELGYVRGTVDEFIHRVEDRSSLLAMTGLDVEDGRLVEFYEFRHLTFQEYLTARAMVEGWHPDRRESDTLVDVLEPHLSKEEWREVVPLAAVLAGKETEALLRRIVAILDEADLEKPSRHAVMLLGNCLADEAAARPDTVRSAIKKLIRHGGELENTPFIQALVRGRYGSDFRQEARSAIMDENSDHHNVTTALTEAVWWQTHTGRSIEAYQETASQFLSLLERAEKVDQCEGALGMVFLAHHIANYARELSPALRDQGQVAGNLVTRLIYADDPMRQYVGSFALVWLGSSELWRPITDPDVIGQLFFLATQSPVEEIKKRAGWALSVQPLMSRNDGHARTVSRDDFDRLPELTDGTARVARLVIAWYTHFWSDGVIRAEAHELKKIKGDEWNKTISAILLQLAE